MNEQTRPSMRELRELIAKSSLGGAAWCSNCGHPDLLHERAECFGLEAGRCPCPNFKAMTPAEWMKRP